MSLKLKDSGPPIVQPSNCFKNLLLNLKIHSVASVVFCFVVVVFFSVASVVFYSSSLNYGEFINYIQSNLEYLI